MAGRGPAPKDPERRQRRNKPKPAEQLPAEAPPARPKRAKKSAEPPVAVLPNGFVPLPDTYTVTVKMREDGQTWEEDLPRTYLPETREWYETWARSPQATKLASTDRIRLRHVIAPLFDAVIRGDLAKASELRLQETSIGGTVLDRQRLGWKVPEGPAPDAAEPPAPAARPVNTARRARLTAVK